MLGNEIWIVQANLRLDALYLSHNCLGRYHNFIVIYGDACVWIFNSMIVFCKLIEKVIRRFQQGRDKGHPANHFKREVGPILPGITKYMGGWENQKDCPSITGMVFMEIVSGLYAVFALENQRHAFSFYRPKQSSYLAPSFFLFFEVFRCNLLLNSFVCRVGCVPGSLACFSCASKDSPSTNRCCNYRQDSCNQNLVFSYPSFGLTPVTSMSGSDPKKSTGQYAAKVDRPGVIFHLDLPQNKIPVRHTGKVTTESGSGPRRT